MPWVIMGWNNLVLKEIILTSNYSNGKSVHKLIQLFNFILSLITGIILLASSFTVNPAPIKFVFKKS